MDTLDEQDQQLAKRFVSNAITSSLAAEAARDGDDGGSPIVGRTVRSHQSQVRSMHRRTRKSHGTVPTFEEVDHVESAAGSPMNMHNPGGPLGRMSRINSTASMSNLMHGFAPSFGAGLGSSCGFGLGSGLQIDTDISRTHSLAASRAASVVFTGLTSIVDDVLALGAHRDVCDLKAIRSLGIRAFLCVAKEVTNVLPPFVTDHDLDCGAVEFKHMQLADVGATRLEDSYAEVFDYIDRNAAAGRPVALFCQQGKSRSVSFVVAYLMREHQCDAEEALSLVSSIYPKADPNIGFIGQLKDLDHTMLPKRVHPRPSEAAGMPPQDSSATPNETPISSAPEIAMTPPVKTRTAEPSPMGCQVIRDDAIVTLSSALFPVLPPPEHGATTTQPPIVFASSARPLPSYLKADDDMHTDIPWVEEAGSPLGVPPTPAASGGVVGFAHFPTAD